MGSRKVREHYRTINGCKRQIQCQQVFWVFGVFTILGSFSGMVAPPIAQNGNFLLVAFMAIVYAIWPIIIYDYCKLTLTDPVDPNILSEQNYSDGQVKMCSVCQLWVKKDTEHCLTCQRCTERMDHHSQLVNNCISISNHNNYVRMNILFCLVTVIMGIEAIVMFTMTSNDPKIQQYTVNRYFLAALGALYFLVSLFSMMEVFFSCYLRLKSLTRIGYRFR